MHLEHALDVRLEHVNILNVHFEHVLLVCPDLVLDERLEHVPHLRCASRARFECASRARFGCAYGARSTLWVCG